MNFMVTVETLKYIDLYLPPFLKTKYIFSFFSFINLYHESFSTKYTYAQIYFVLSLPPGIYICILRPIFLNTKYIFKESFIYICETSFTYSPASPLHAYLYTMPTVFCLFFYIHNTYTYIFNL